ncbi:MAG: hypothetical protein KF889_06190 [Alphaproteobacteria bacterium]|nr:hypothetical protein [Alphaproteobacteria bacterium]MCW5740407.1 hypothetical protein [Alphaproteobacteria bacterium]
MDEAASPWGEIQHDALARGELVYAMNEGWASLSEGTGFALGWIGLRAWDRDYAFSLREKPVRMPVADGGFTELSRDLALCRAAGGFLARVETVLRQYAVPLDSRRYMQTTRPINAGIVLGRIWQGDGLYCFEIAREGGSHALAVQRSRGTYRLFDCHHGHFAIEGLREFASFLESFLRLADYGRVYTKGTTVAGAGAVAWRPAPDMAATIRAPMRPAEALSPGEQRSAP